MDDAAVARRERAAARRELADAERRLAAARWRERLVPRLADDAAAASPGRGRRRRSPERGPGGLSSVAAAAAAAAARSRPSPAAPGAISAARLWQWAFGVTIAFYVAAMVVSQQRHLAATSANVATRLAASKDAFVAGLPGGGGGGRVGSGGESVSVRSYRPAAAILRDPKLPEWVRTYAAWHGLQRRRYLVAKRNRNPAAVADIKFLVSRCFRQDMCGGASDRLQDMPYNLMIANQTQRVLLLRWEKPAPLETFLVPPEGGIDWTLPNEMYNMSQCPLLVARAPSSFARAQSHSFVQ